MVTNATPNVNANAVVAVRRGFRREFVAANLPTARNGNPNSRPMIPTTRIDNAGATINTPMVTNTAPAPTANARVCVS